MKPVHPATLKRQQKSMLMTMFLKDYERVTGKRITVELIQSQEWRELQRRFIEIFLPLMERSNP